MTSGIYTNLPLYPPDGLSAVNFQEWAARWSSNTRRLTAEYIRHSRTMPVEDWIAGGRYLHWQQGRSAEAYKRAREAAE